MESLTVIIPLLFFERRVYVDKGFNIFNVSASKVKE